MDPVPPSKTLTTHPHRWEEFWGTVMALLTLTLPLAAIATYAPSSPPGEVTTEISTHSK